MQTLLKNTQAYKLLQAEAKSNRCGHAYLLLFEDARNLRIALKTFAKLLFGCFDETPTRANQRISDLIDAESFSDCLFFPSEGKKLSVEDAEKIQEECTLNPVEGNKKVFILSDFADANVQTQNKLLKLLEEPPTGVAFLLGATSVFPVLPTVLSRTKKLEILPFTAEEVTRCLTRIYGEKFPSATLALCAATSGGIVGEAQNLLEGGYYGNLISEGFQLVHATPETLPKVIKQVGETKYKKEFLSVLRIIFRDALLVKTQENYTKNLLLGSEKERLLITANRYSVSALIYAQEALSKAELQVKFNAIFPQCIELCFANIFEKNKIKDE